MSPGDTMYHSVRGVIWGRSLCVCVPARVHVCVHTLASVCVVEGGLRSFEDTVCICVGVCVCVCVRTFLRARVYVSARVGVCGLGR